MLEKKLFNSSLRNFRKAGNELEKDQLKLIFLQKKRTYINLKKAKKLKFFNAIQSSLCNAKNSSDFWKAINYYRSKRNCNGNYDNDQTITPVAFHDHFSKIFDTNEQKDTLPNDELSIINDDTDGAFTSAELNIVIKKLSTGKAPGPDSIPNEAWKGLNDMQRLILLDSINLLWESQQIPDGWADIIISPIYKKGDKLDPKNYRPISLINTGLKLYTMLLTNRLNEWCEKHEKISQFQAANRKGMGCEDHIFMLNSILQHIIRNKRGKVYALLVDLSSAFDRVKHDQLWKKLKLAGISDKMLNTIKNIYAKAKAKVRTRHGESNFFPFKKAVLQGETLSPKLYTFIQMTCLTSCIII